VNVEVGHATSVGQVRSGNEDSVLCEPVEAPTVPERGLFCAVADGMGGHADGGIASSMAVRKTRDLYYEAGTSSTSDALQQAIRHANNDVFAAGAAKTGREHMGSTLTAVVVFDDHAIIGHVGDSRCYLVEHDAIRQVTRDHSWVAEEVEAGALTPEEARVHPRRNIITRALGLHPDVEVDIYETGVGPGSILVLCSDGLHGPVRDEEILAYASNLTPQEAVEGLISLANQRGGPDNISAVVVRVRGEDDTDTTTRRAVLDEDRTPPALPALVTGPPTAPTTPETVESTSAQSSTTQEPTRAAAEPAPGGTWSHVEDESPSPSSERRMRGIPTFALVILALAILAGAGFGLWLWIVGPPP
jgi:PPM family protein phosphatase